MIQAPIRVPQEASNVDVLVSRHTPHPYCPPLYMQPRKARAPDKSSGQGILRFIPAGISVPCVYGADGDTSAGMRAKKDHGGPLRGKRVLDRPLVLYPISSDVSCLPVPTLLSMCDVL